MNGVIDKDGYDRSGELYHSVIFKILHYGKLKTMGEEQVKAECESRGWKFEEVHDRKSGRHSVTIDLETLEQLDNYGVYEDVVKRTNEEDLVVFHCVYIDPTATFEEYH